MKRVLTAIIFLVLLIGLVGCSEVEKDTTVKSKDVTATTDSSDEQVQEVETSADLETGSDDSFADKFAELASKKWNKEYMVDYDMTTDSDGQNQKMQMRQYFAGEGKIRSDVIVDGREARTFILSDGIYMCTKDGSWMCLAFGTKEDLEAQSQDMAFEDVEKMPDKYNVQYAGTMTVAGTKTYCYAFVVEGGKLKECFSKEGVPLYMEVSAQGMNTKMVATEYKTSVSASDFKLPAEPTDMQAMMTEQMQGMGNMPEGYEMPDMSAYQ